MRRRYPCLKAAVALGCLSLGVRAAVPAVVPDWGSYDLILKRNVFDPARRQLESHAPTAQTKVEKTTAAPAPDAVDLRGVFIDGANASALLTGSRPEWQGPVTLQTGKPVGPAVVRKVAIEGLTVEIDGKTLEWPVGSRLVKQDGHWSVDQQVGSPPPAPAGTSEVESGSSASPAAASDAGGTAAIDRNAILKRLMERRMKENKQ